MANERLRSAMAAARIDLDAAATAAMVDPKTVQRWLNGRVPHARHRWKLVELLGEEETYLWPEAANGARTREASKAELVTLYPQRADVPLELWSGLFRRAERSIDIVVYAAVFLHEQDPDLNDLLREKADDECRVRIAIGDPSGACVQARGQEERFGHGIATRCELALMHYRPLFGHPRISVHVHDTTLYNSIYRFDDELLVNAHVWGWNAFAAPVLHVRRLAGGRLFSTYVQSFDAIWEQSRPAT
jgi:transcriptional regulator with XRE-family HTH domain